MATIEHKDIPDLQRHEPKGASSAVAGTQYVANGAGSGSWINPDPKGFSAALNNQVLSKDAGVVSWKYPAGHVFTEIDIINNINIQALTYNSGDSRALALSTDSNYTKMSGTNFPFVETSSALITFDSVNDDIVIDVAGTYKIDFWSSVKCSEANTFIGIKYAKNNLTPFSVQKLVGQSSSSNDVINISAAGIVTDLAVGDTISLYIAAWRSIGSTTNIVVEDGGMTVMLLKEA